MVIVSPIEEKKSTKNFHKITSFGGGILGLILSQYFGLTFLIFIFVWFVGRWFPKWYLKKTRENSVLIKLIIWSNIFTWVLPPLGLMVGFTTFEFGNQLTNNRKKYKTAGIIGIIASILNGFSGILVRRFFH